MPTTINGGLYRREASFIPDSINKEKRTITFCWSTGSRVLRVPWFDDPFYEELSMDAEHIRLNRLNNAAPFLKMHRSYELNDSIGVTREFNLYISYARADDYSDDNSKPANFSERVKN